MFEDSFYDMLRQYPDAVNEKKRFVGLLRDCFPGQQMQINLLATAFDTGIASELQTTNQISNTFAFRFVKRLVDDYGINRLNADWAISVWCVCYGQRLLNKPCDIKLSRARSGAAPSIREERPSNEAKQYSELFRYVRLSDGYGVAGFSGANKATLIFSNKYKGQPVISIMKEAFMECEVHEAVFTEGITRIEENAFKGCPHMKQAILPQSLREIGDGAFCGCTELVTVALPYAIEQIGSYAFSGTDIKTVSYPDSLCWIGEGAYSNCNKLEAVTLPKSITKVSKAMFMGCTGLVKVKLPASLEAIEDGAFADCSSLQAIEIPENVSSIGEGAFIGCHPKFTLLCKRLSVAEQYARRNNIRFQLIY